jgi:hypothetical protein
MRSAVRLVCLLATILLVACSGPKPAAKEPPKPVVATSVYNLHVDEVFSPAERAVVIDSFAEWERDTHGVVKFTLSHGKFNSDRDEMLWKKEACTSEVFVVHVTSTDKSVKDLEARKAKEHGRPFTVLGFTRSTCEERFVALVMDRLANPALLRNVGVHEAGHLVGLDHIPVPGESVMFPSMDKAAKRPTSLDMKQLCMLHKCDWRDTVYEN